MCNRYSKAVDAIDKDSNSSIDSDQNEIDKSESNLHGSRQMRRGSTGRTGDLGGRDADGGSVLDGSVKSGDYMNQRGAGGGALNSMQRSSGGGEATTVLAHSQYLEQVA